MQTDICALCGKEKKKHHKALFDNELHCPSNNGYYITRYYTPLAQAHEKECAVHVAPSRDTAPVSGEKTGTHFHAIEGGEESRKGSTNTLSGHAKFGSSDVAHSNCADGFSSEPLPTQQKVENGDSMTRGETPRTAHSHFDGNFSHYIVECYEEETGNWVNMTQTFHNTMKYANVAKARFESNFPDFKFKVRRYVRENDDK